MAIEDAEKFLRAVNQDADFRDELVALFDQSIPYRDGLLGATTDGIPEGLAGSPGLEAARAARDLIKSKGFSFTREELQQVAGAPTEATTPQDEIRLRLIDKTLREKGLGGINPLAYTAYSLGVANKEA